MRMRTWATIDMHIEHNRSQTSLSCMKDDWWTRYTCFSISSPKPHSDRTAVLPLAPCRLLVLDRHIAASGAFILAADVVLHNISQITQHRIRAVSIQTHRDLLILRLLNGTLIVLLSLAHDVLLDPIDGYASLVVCLRLHGCNSKIEWMCRAHSCQSNPHSSRSTSLRRQLRSPCS
jgi:hypothetical protein